MNNVKNNIRKSFTIAPNELINNNKITDRARFLFIYMCSKPDDWKFWNLELTKALGYSQDTLRKYINELVNSGWIIKESQKRDLGKFKRNIYTLNSVPIQNLPCRKNTDTVKNRHSKKHTHSNKDITNKENKRRNKFIS